MDWTALADEIFEASGTRYDPADLQSPDWCARELARMGYSINFLFTTLEYATHVHGRPPAMPEAFAGVPVTYQLWGPLYPERGAHPSPLCPSLQVAAATALYNMRRKHGNPQ